MAETIMSFSVIKPHIQTTKLKFNSFSTSLRQCSSSRFGCGNKHQKKDGKNNRDSRIKVNALPDWPLMAVLVEHAEGQRDLITHKSIWHLSDEAMKNTQCISCLLVGDAVSLVRQKVYGQDPYYDSEAYREDGGDGTGHWVYEKQEDIEETARAELLREELIEEIEKKVGGLRELEEASKKEELVK